VTDHGAASGGWNAPVLIISTANRAGQGLPPPRRGPVARASAVLALVIAALAAATAAADEELDYGLELQPLARIEITGNETFDDSAIKRILTIEEPDWRRPLAVPRYRPELVERQLRLIDRFYRRRGFHQVAVQLDSIGTLPERGDVLYISIREGPRTWIEKVRLFGTAPLDSAEVRARLRFRAGDPCPADLNDFGPDIYAIRTLYWDNAFLDVRIEPALSVAPTGDPNRYAATVEYRITPGRAYTITDIEITGNESTKLELIERELRVEVGGPFSWGLVEESRRRLLGTSLFRDVAFTPVGLDSVRGTGALALHVVERKPAFYELGAGVGSRERIRLSGAWGHNNLWGTGRRLRLSAKGYYNVEEILGQPRSFGEGEVNYRFEALYVNPHFASSDFTLDIYSYLKRETRGESGLILDTYAIAVGTERRFGVRWDHRLAAQLKETRPRIHPDAGEELAARFARANVTKNQTRSLIYSLLHDRRDDPFQPNAGNLSSMQAELAGGLFGGDNSFVKWWGARHDYVRFFLGGVIATRIRIGVVTPYAGSAEEGADGVPYDDRYFAGGATTVRGYRENSLGPQIQDQDELDELQFGSDVPLAGSPARGGNYQLLTNLEWRFPMPLLRRWNFSGVLFFDAGNVWENIADIRLKGFRLRSVPGDPDDPNSTRLWDYRYSVGTGLRLDTPFGPFRIDVGFPLKRARYESVDPNDPSKTKTFTDDTVLYHFSLGYPF
jgi:outer membrane protein assembly complex protein YaeT